jgi:urease subunit alpha
MHAYHVEGCGGGHVPNVLELAGVPHVIGSSTNPTLPYARDAVAEHEAMIIAVHGLRPSLPGEMALARDRVRSTTMAAETVLHDLGVIPITSSDAQGMGRVGETIRRTFAMAAANRAQRGALETDGELQADNLRVLRYLAKLTINPAIAHGIDHEVGSLEPGKLADIVLWRPELFGAKPQLVLKAGLPAWGSVGDPNAAIDAAEPLVLGPQFGGSGAAPSELSVVFVNGAAMHAGQDLIPTRRRRVAVNGTRGIGLREMLGGNSRLGVVRVDPAGAAVTLDGDPLRAAPVANVPLARLYHL